MEISCTVRNTPIKDTRIGSGLSLAFRPQVRSSFIEAAPYSRGETHYGFRRKQVGVKFSRAATEITRTAESILGQAHQIEARCFSPTKLQARNDLPSNAFAECEESLLYGSSAMFPL